MWRADLNVCGLAEPAVERDQAGVSPLVRSPTKLPPEAFSDHTKARAGLCVSHMYVCIGRRCIFSAQTDYVLKLLLSWADYVDLVVVVVPSVPARRHVCRVGLRISWPNDAV